MSVLYVLWRDQVAGYDLLTMLGVREPDRLNDLIGLNGEPSPVYGSRAAKVVAMGGEMG